jgi:hypothetical protein
MRPQILSLLAGLEAEHGIRILYACESGSRAWGFPSPDSDYDVRFVYAHPAEWYFSVEDLKDTLERPVSEGLDAGGWELRKALRGLRKSNATLFEWLQSPVVYREAEGFAEAMRELMHAYFSPRAVVYHHLGLVRKMWLEVGPATADLRLKTAFYLLRSLLSAAWVLEKGSLPPMAFEPLRPLIRDPDLARLVDRWLAQKTQSDERTRVPLPGPFRAFIEGGVALCETHAPSAPVNQAGPERLNEFFRQTILLPHDH